ncbi:MAG: hypothetical protein K2X93_07840 [Candidatus Obscuribacterales bacterium]|nr:hypothetical protein [Candidatus Obscuribacterales bacterium]
MRLCITEDGDMKLFGLRKQLQFACLMLALTSVGVIDCFSAAQAQPKGQPRRPGQGWQPPLTSAVRKEAPAEFSSQNLDQEIALPNIPSYTGKQVFMNGVTYPNAKTGPGYYLTYNTEHTPQQVKDWWSNALKVDPWKITSTEGSVLQSVGRDGAHCIITTGPMIRVPKEKTKGMRGSYTIFYQQPQKKN